MGQTINGIPLVTRVEWGARRPREVTKLPVGQAYGVAIHYTASQAPQRHSECDDSVRAIQAFHMDTNGWNDIAYSHIVCRHGVIYRCRGIGVRTAANGTTDSNSHYYAVCFLGTDNVNRDDLTPESRKALTALLLWYDRQIPRRARYRPHSDFTSTSCPGDELRRFLAVGGWRE